MKDSKTIFKLKIPDYSKLQKITPPSNLFIDRNIWKEKYDLIGAKEGIYFLFQYGEIVYVGVSCDIHRRITQHKRDKRFDLWSYYECNDFIASMLELYFIDKLKPRYNKNK